MAIDLFMVARLPVFNLHEKFGLGISLRFQTFSPSLLVTKFSNRAFNCFFCALFLCKLGEFHFQSKKVVFPFVLFCTIYWFKLYYAIDNGHKILKNVIFCAPKKQNQKKIHNKFTVDLPILLIFCYLKDSFYLLCH